MSIICTICARGGSKGVPGKNIRDLLGKPLIVHTIEKALACDFFDDVYVSTDSGEMAEIAKQAGAKVPFLRPAELATDDAPKVPVIEHLVGWIEENEGKKIDKVVDLDATSPLRDVSDIKNTLDLLDDETDVVFTVYESEKNPYFNMVEVDDSGFAKLSKKPESELFTRQSSPVNYAINGSVYAWQRASLGKGLWGGKSKIFVMPRERSIDIDSEIDFKLVELLMKEKMG